MQTLIEFCSYHILPWCGKNLRRRMEKPLKLVWISLKYLMFIYNSNQYKHLTKKLENWSVWCAHFKYFFKCWQLPTILDNILELRASPILAQVEMISLGLQDHSKAAPIGGYYVLLPELEHPMHCTPQGTHLVLSDRYCPKGATVRFLSFPFLKITTSNKSYNSYDYAFLGTKNQVTFTYNYKFDVIDIEILTKAKV